MQDVTHNDLEMAFLKAPKHPINTRLKLLQYKWIIEGSFSHLIPLLLIRLRLCLLLLKLFKRLHKFTLIVCHAYGNFVDQSISGKDVQLQSHICLALNVLQAIAAFSLFEVPTCTTFQ